MEDVKALLIGISGGLVVLALSKVYRGFRKRSIQDDIRFLEFERQHLEEMKRSSVELNRSSFRAIFALFLFIGLSNLSTIFFAVIDPVALSGVSSLFNLLIWAMFVGLCIKFWRRYDNLKNYKEATRKMNERLETLQDKLDKHS